MTDASGGAERTREKSDKLTENDRERLVSQEEEETYVFDEETTDTDRETARQETEALGEAEASGDQTSNTKVHLTHQSEKERTDSSEVGGGDEEEEEETRMRDDSDPTYESEEMVATEPQTAAQDAETGKSQTQTGHNGDKGSEGDEEEDSDVVILDGPSGGKEEGKEDSGTHRRISARVALQNSKREEEEEERERDKRISGL